MRKKKYESPVTEQTFVRFELNIMSVVNTNKPDMGLEEWTAWDD